MLAVRSARPYTLTGSAGLVQARQVVSNAVGVNNRFTLLIDGSNSLDWWFEQGSLFAFYTLNGVSTTAATLSYDATQHAWWRIRESGGMVYWETSADSVAWTSRASVASSALFDLSLLYARFYSETWGSGTPTPGIAKYANFNNAPSAFLVSGVPAIVTAGSAAMVTVEVKDAVGNRATGYRGTVAFTSTDPQAVLPTNHTFTATDAGIYLSSVTLKTAATQSIAATDTAIASLTRSQTGIQVQPAVAAPLSLSGLGITLTAGQSTSLTAEARDAYGNRATGYRGTVSFTSNDPQSALPSPFTFASPDAGIKVFSGIVLRTSGSQTVTASDGTISGIHAAVQVGPAAATAVSVSGVSPNPTAGIGVATVVTALDPYGNMATSYSGTVRFSSSDPRAQLPVDSTFLPADLGRRSICCVTFATAGSQSITATDTGIGIASGTQPGILVRAAPASTLAVTAVASPISAGAGSSATVTALDSYGNVDGLYRGTVRFASSDPQATLPANYAFTSIDAGARSFVNVVLKTAGIRSVTATDTVTASIAGTQSGIVVNPGPATVLVLAAPSTVPAGTTVTFSVEARDAYANRAVTYAGSVAFTSTDTQAALPATYTFVGSDGGYHPGFSATFRTAGSRTLTAGDGIISATPATLQVGAAAASSLVFNGISSSVTAGSSSSLTLEARDAFSNTASGYLGTVQFASTDGRATLPANYAFVAADGGRHVFSVILATSGTQSVSATDLVQPSIAGSQSGIAVSPAAPASFVVGGLASPREAGAAGSLTIDVRDAFGNRASAYLGTVSFASSDTRAMLPAAVTFAFANQGLRTVGGVALLTPGSQTVTVLDGTISGVESSISVVDTSPPSWPAPKSLAATARDLISATLSWSAAADVVGVTTYRVFLNGVVAATAGGTVFTANVSGLTTGQSYTFAVQAGDAAGNFSLDGPMTTFVATPPDPVLVAPALDRTVVSGFADSTAFLYSGPNPVQTGVAAGTIQAYRAAVLRGSVHTRSGSPVVGAKISVLSHPEYGQTWTRADGAFDMAINGGGPTTLELQHDGFLPVQRQLTPDWQNYAVAADVVMIPYDNLVSIIDLTNTSLPHVARGGVSSDANGPRQATVIFPPGTVATMTLPNASTQSLSSMHVRATEYTVGGQGPAAMPLDLPKTSAYTYAVAFTVDEADAAQATALQFSQTVYGYVENFLRFPVGTPVPSGYRDRFKSQWIAQDNGRVIKILDTTSGSATVDVDGTGVAATSARMTALGLSASELSQLAALYQAGQTLWRVPMQHFTDEDWNYPPGLPSVPPIPNVKPTRATPTQCEDSRHGSIVGCFNQTLGERINLIGTPYSLAYQSERTPGRAAARRMDIPLPAQFTVSAISPTCTAPDPRSCVAQPVIVAPFATVNIAGRSFSQSAGAGASVWNFLWDGKDAYGRVMQGQQPITVTLCELVPGVNYGSPGEIGRSFAVAAANGSVMSAGRDGYYYQLCSVTWRGVIGEWDAKAIGLGGWTISAQHGYDSANATVYRGDGKNEYADDLNRGIVHFYGGNPQDGLPLVNGPSTFLVRGQMATGADGSLYAADNSILWRVGPDKIAHRFAGGAPGFGTGDGGPATSASLWTPTAVAVGPDGSVYVVDTGSSRIRRIDPNGTIRTVAGTGTAGFSPDGTVATQAALNLNYSYAWSGLLVAPDGRLIFSDVVNNRIRSIGTDGILRTIAGAGPIGNNEGTSQPPNGDGGFASQAILGMPRGIALAKDGTMFFVDNCGLAVRKITPDQKISTLFGSIAVGYPHGCFAGTSGGLTDIVLDDDGTLFVGDRGLVRRMRPDGSITNFAGTGGEPYTCIVDSCPSTQIAISFPLGLVAAPDHSLFLSEANQFIYAGILHLTAGIATATVAQTTVASSDGTEAYVFDGRGRHLRTVDAVTGVILAQLGYDAAGMLTSVKDRDGNITTIARDAQENPTAVVGPYGQQTKLTLDNNGYLSSVIDPANQTMAPTHQPNGLLTQLIDARSNVHTFAYDASGFLQQDTEPGGAFQTLNRNGSLTAGKVTHQTALGRTTAYSATWSETEDSRTQTITDPASLTSTSKWNPDHTWSRQSPNGMIMTGTEKPNPRFGIASPIQGSINSTTPSGIVRTTGNSQALTLSDSNDPLSVSTLTETSSVNGRSYQSTYSRAASTITSTTPAGRSTVTTLDTLGRVAQVAPPGVSGVALKYDLRGRISTVTQGTRILGITYDANGFPLSITDPLNHVTTLTNDPAGRTTQELLPDSNTVGASYDASSNVTSVTPSGRPAHLFSFSPFDSPLDYTAPQLSTQSFVEHIDYNLDKQVSLLTRPAGDTLTPGYDAAGRLATLASSATTVTTTYDPTKGLVTRLSDAAAGTLDFTYDGALPTSAKWTGPVSGTVSRTYDTDFRVATESVNGAQVASYGYDADSLLTSAGALTIARAPATGLVSGTTLGSMTDSHTYNAFGEEQSYAASYGATTLYSVDYGTRDGLGRIAHKTETIQGVTHVYDYSYDAVGRLTNVSRDTVQTSHYTYDANGNRLSALGLTGTPTYDAQDRLSSYGNCTYGYKLDGSLQTKTSASSTTSYNYDPLGNLRHVTPPNGTNIDYIIDAQNRRIGKQINGALVEGFLYRTHLQPAAWLDGTGAVKATFVYGLHPNVPEYMVQGTTTYRIITDQVGSVRLVVNTATGAVAERIDWDEFGNLVADSAPGTQPFGFAGGMRDVDTGLTRFGARDYDPVTGRWTAKDPLRFGGGLTDLYSYVGSDPINRIDPDGLDVYVCEVRADVYGNIFDLSHKWIKTDSGEGGLGPCGGGVPGAGGGSPDLPFTRTCNNDHAGRSSVPGASCKRVDDADEPCVNSKILVCGAAGRWMPGNTCWSYVDKVLNECRKPPTNMCQ